jgi:hypothetical protein
MIVGHLTQPTILLDDTPYGRSNRRCHRRNDRRLGLRRSGPAQSTDRAIARRPQRYRVRRASQWRRHSSANEPSAYVAMSQYFAGCKLAAFAGFASFRPSILASQRRRFLRQPNAKAERACLTARRRSGRLVKRKNLNGMSAPLPALRLLLSYPSQFSFAHISPSALLGLLHRNTVKFVSSGIA